MTRRILRWRFIVDWKLQGSLCVHGVLYGLLVLVAVSLGIFLPLLWNLSDADQVNVLEDQAVVMLYMHERFWWLALLCLAIVVLGAVKFSHRIAGPLVRYKRNLRLLADGKLPSPLRTRAGDYLQDEVACLNQAVAGITTRIEAMQQSHVILHGEIQGAMARLSRQAAFELEPVLLASRELQQCLAAIQRFDTKDDVVPQPTPVTRPDLALAGTSGRGD